MLCHEIGSKWLLPIKLRITNNEMLVLESSIMALYDTLAKALDERDAGMYTDLLHADYEFVRHQTGTSMHREQMVEMMNLMMANEKVVIRDARCVYENDEILVEHSVMDFPDGTTEAVMGVHTLKDGLIVRTETGATLISK